MLETKHEIWREAEGWEVFAWLWDQEIHGWSWKPPAVKLPDGTQQFYFERRNGDPVVPAV